MTYARQMLIFVDSAVNCVERTGGCSVQNECFVSGGVVTTVVLLVYVSVIFHMKTENYFQMGN